MERHCVLEWGSWLVFFFGVLTSGGGRTEGLEQVGKPFPGKEPTNGF